MWEKRQISYAGELQVIDGDALCPQGKWNITRFSVSVGYTEPSVGKGAGERRVTCKKPDKAGRQQEIKIMHE